MHYFVEHCLANTGPLVSHSANVSQKREDYLMLRPHADRQTHPRTHTHACMHADAKKESPPPFERFLINVMHQAESPNWFRKLRVRLKSQISVCFIGARVEAELTMGPFNSSLIESTEANWEIQSGLLNYVISENLCTNMDALAFFVSLTGTLGKCAQLS